MTDHALAIIVNLIPRCELNWAALTKELRPTQGQYQLVIATFGKLMDF